MHITGRSFFWCVTLVVTFLVVPTCQAQQPRRAVPLTFYWNSLRKDNLCVGASAEQKALHDANYEWVRTEGYVFATREPGTVPVCLYWHPIRQDNFTAVTERGKKDAVAFGYRFVRIIGYVYPTKQPGTVPMTLYWNEQRLDNCSVVSVQGRRVAEGAGYRRVRVQGWVLSKKPRVANPRPILVKERESLSTGHTGHHMEANLKISPTGQVTGYVKLKCTNNVFGFTGGWALLLLDRSNVDEGVILYPLQGEKPMIGRAGIDAAGLFSGKRERKIPIAYSFPKDRFLDVKGAQIVLFHSPNPKFWSTVDKSLEAGAKAAEIYKKIKAAGAGR